MGFQEGSLGCLARLLPDSELLPGARRLPVSRRSEARRRRTSGRPPRRRFCSCSAALPFRYGTSEGIPELLHLQSASALHSCLPGARFL